MTCHLMHENERDGGGVFLTSLQRAELNRMERESQARHYVWGLLIALTGMYTAFGYWFLFVG